MSLTTTTKTASIMSIDRLLPVVLQRISVAQRLNQPLHHHHQFYAPKSTTSMSILFCRSMTVMSKQSAEEYKKTNYSERMQKLGRPVSPHVTIYAFPVAALSSITNRVTGCALAVGAFGLGSAELISGSGTALSLMESIGGSNMLVATSTKLAISFPIIYHFLGALRHFVWDSMPERVSNHDAETSSYVLFGSATILSIGISTLV